MKKIKLFNVNNHTLDKNQSRVVFDEAKHLLVIAGAGSGKSLTIIGKIKYLIEEKNIKEEEILCISFTNDAVNNLKNKVNYNIDIFTFHKIALDTLKDTSEYNIALDNELEYVIDEYLHLINHESKNNLNFKKLISQFINLFKSNNYVINNFRLMLSKCKKKDELATLILIIRIYLIYEIELQSQGLIDFNDMISLATKKISKQGLEKHYKYIIIDEYQDTSLMRVKLIQTMMHTCNSKLMVVGDDFQSIFRFTGCDLNIFIHFKRYFKKPRIMKITHTYRNSQQLINIASDFIMKNKRQIKKKLKSNKKLSKPIVICYIKDKVSTLKKLISELDSQIMILGRNNADIYNYIDSDYRLDQKGTLIYKRNENLKIRFLTVHKSKGLESDNVILINCENSIIGFPSKMIDDPILRFVTIAKDIYPHEEERRLFYVALTRTKNKVYLLVQKNRESVFIKELMRDYKNHIEIRMP